MGFRSEIKLGNNAVDDYLQDVTVAALYLSSLWDA
jgi:hypothetical protein